jgi:hypothetical protein
MRPLCEIKKPCKSMEAHPQKPTKNTPNPIQAHLAKMNKSRPACSKFAPENAPKTVNHELQAFDCYALPEAVQEEFENARDYIEERAAILEYEAGMAREDAERQAECLALERFPPSPEARAFILAEAGRVAAHCGFPGWSAEAHLPEAHIRRLHVNADYWESLREYFAALRKGGQRNELK